VTAGALLAALVAGLAALLWPSGRAVRDRSDRRGPPRPRPATVEEAAAALGLVAAALRSGVGSVEALESVADVTGGPAGRELAVVAAAHRWGQAPGQAWAHVGPGWAAAAVAWHAAHAAGAAPAGLLTAAAERMRALESLRVEAAVQRAAVLLVLPLGACFLPGFVATTVAPVVLHLVGGLAP
jgi:pilus assembly protein TadC